MGKIADLSAKFQALLVKINVAVAGKLDATATAVNSTRLGNKTLSEVRELAVTDTLAEVALNQADIKGQYGEVAFFSDSNVPMALRGQPLLKAVNMISADAELTTAQSASVPFSEVFNKWKRISHGTSGIFPAVPGELSGWAYDSVTDSISSTINSVSVIGIISNDRFQEYTLETIIKSTAADNDGAGLCMAYLKVGDREHTVVAMVDGGGMAADGTIPNGNVPKLVIAVNYGQGPAWGHQVLAELPFGPPMQNWNTADLAAGVKLKVKRLNTGAFEVNCTRADGSAWPNAVYWTGNVPELFSGLCHIGFVAVSQAGSTWQVLQMPVIKRDIIDTRTMTVWRWNGTAWINAGSALDHNVLMPGRIYKNVFAAPHTAFYLDHDGSTYVLGSPGSISL